MTRAEQRTMVDDLRPKIRLMSAADKGKFEALAKRDKDDEDLDVLAQRELERLHAAYLPAKSKAQLEDLWKKMTTKPKGPS